MIIGASTETSQYFNCKKANSSTLKIYLPAPVGISRFRPLATVSEANLSLTEQGGTLKTDAEYCGETWACFTTIFSQATEPLSVITK